jgi:PAS domain S-box-containing protein
MRQRRLISAPIRIMLVYLLLAGVWFSLTDFSAHLSPLQIMRDAVFAVISAGGLYLIVRREFTLRAEAQSQLENILATADDAIITIDETQRIQWFNQAAEQLFGYRAAEIIGQPIDRLLPIEARELHRQHIARFALAPDLSRPMSQQRVVMGQRQDGSRFTAEAGISKLNQHGRPSFTVIIRDVTAQQRAEAALFDSEARYRSIIEAMEEGVVFQDAAGQILTCNASAERILDLSFDQLVGRTSLDSRWHTLHEDGTPFPGSDHPAMVTLRTGQPQSNVIMGVGKPDGTLTWITINAQPLFHAGNDRPYAVVVTFGDITERKRAEQTLQLAEARYRARLEERVAQRTRELASLLDISHRLSTTLELKLLLGLILDQVQAIIAYDFGLIFAVNGGGDDTVAYAIRRDGPSPPLAARRPLGIEQLRPILEAGTAPIHVPDVTGDSPQAQLFQRTVAACLGEAAASIRAWLWTPLVVNDRLIGGLSLAHSVPQRYAENQVGLLTTIANQAAVAIENARLYGEARELAALQERQRLARELHDSVTQQLFSASLIAEVLPQLYEQDQTEGREYLDDVRRLTRGALAEMRTLLMELRPAALHEAALSELVRQLAEAFTGHTRVPVQFDLDGEPAPPSDVKIAVYRIVQEALNNVAKHAKARHVIIQLRGDRQAIALQIADDGRGFDRAQVRSDRLGLTIMRERVQAIGAALSIESEPDRGTTLRLIWPTASAPSKE